MDWIDFDFREKTLFGFVFFVSITVSISVLESTLLSFVSANFVDPDWWALEDPFAVSCFGLLLNSPFSSRFILCFDDVVDGILSCDDNGVGSSICCDFEEKFGLSLVDDVINFIRSFWFLAIFNLLNNTKHLYLDTHQVENLRHSASVLIPFLSKWMFSWDTHKDTYIDALKKIHSNVLGHPDWTCIDNEKLNRTHILTWNTSTDISFRFWSGLTSETPSEKVPYVPNWNTWTYEPNFFESNERPNSVHWKYEMNFITLGNYWCIMFFSFYSFIFYFKPDQILLTPKNIQKFQCWVDRCLATYL